MRPLRRRLAIAAGIVALVTFAACVTTSAVVHQAAEGRVFSVDAVPARVVVIVPGAGLLPAGTPSPVLEDRLACARDLLRAGKAQEVLVSGDHGTTSYDEPGAMQRWLLDAGVLAERIRLDHAGFRTLDTMARASDVFGVKSAIVCSQRVYLERAVFLARASGIDAVGAEADARLYLGRHGAAVREVVARVAAVVDVYVLHRRARYPG